MSAIRPDDVHARIGQLEQDREFLIDKVVDLELKTAKLLELSKLQEEINRNLQNQIKALSNLVKY